MPISDISARTILNSRGRWTIEVTLKDEEGGSAYASVPEGASRGEREAVYLNPADAVSCVHDSVLPAIQGTALGEQRTFDNLMMELDGTDTKEQLGANVILACSIAYAKLSAARKERPLWQFVRATFPDATRDHTPRLFMNMIEGGEHAGSELAFQEYLVIPETDHITDAVIAGAAFYEQLGHHLVDRGDPRALNVGFEGGYTPAMSADDVPVTLFNDVATGMPEMTFSYGIDAAGSNLERSPEELIQQYQALIDTCTLSYIEDPFHEEDISSHVEFTRQVGDTLAIAGDDLTVTNPERMREVHEADAVNAVIIKPNQVGSLSEAMDAVVCAREWNWAVIASHRGGETNDDWIADIAWAIGADGIKGGAPARGERVAKYNRLLEIESDPQRDA